MSKLRLTTSNDTRGIVDQILRSQPGKPVPAYYFPQILSDSLFIFLDFISVLFYFYFLVRFIFLALTYGIIP